MTKAHPTVGDRVTRSRVPVNGTLNPTMNAPAWLSTIGAALAVLPTDWPIWAKVVVIVAGLAAGIATQYFTVPGADLLESNGPVRRQPGGELGHRDQR